MWIKQIVHDFVKKYKTNDPYELASCKNVHVINFDLHHEINGFYKYDRRNKYIVLNGNLEESYKKFVCAHELGHSQLHPRINTPFLRKSTLLSTNKIENEANRFAVELLLPDSVVYEHSDDSMTINEIGGIYNIPDEVIHLKKI